MRGCHVTIESPVQQFPLIAIGGAPFERGWPMASWPTDWLIRFARADEGLRQAASSGGVGLADLAAISRDHTGGRDSVCTHADPEQPDTRRWATVSSTITDLTEGTTYLAAGPPCSHDYIPSTSRPARWARPSTTSWRRPRGPARRGLPAVRPGARSPRASVQRQRSSIRSVAAFPFSAEGEAIRLGAAWRNSISNRRSPMLPGWRISW